MVSSSPPSEMVTAALLDSIEQLVEPMSAGWVRRGQRVTTMFTGVPIPTLNGAWVHGPATAREEIEAALSEVTAHDVPFCIQATPAAGDGAAALANDRRMVAVPRIPLMTVMGPATVREPLELAVRRLEPGEAALHASLAAAAFGAPAEVFATMISNETLRLPGLRGYVGEVASTPVATALALTLGDATGVFNVATAPEHARRGYATALTGRAIADGRAAGASWAWLQSTDIGYGVYERLGFRTLEHWSCWVDA